VTAAPVEFPVGFEKFSRSTFLNYQLNRCHALGLASRADLEQVAASGRSQEGCVEASISAAEVAHGQGRLANAFACLRLAEFLEPPASSRKGELFDRAIAAFDEAFGGAGVERHQVAWGDGHLSALRLAPRTESRGEAVLVCGGFDSLIEEFYGIWSWFAHQGYEVVAFEGPGQGATLRTHGLRFDHDYEKPTAAVLDHFGLERAALLGLSMGGYWVVRAAAFEPRITRLMVAPPVYDWMRMTNAVMRWIVRQMVKWRWFLNLTVRTKMAVVPVIRHAIHHTLFIAGGAEPIDAVRWIMAMNAEHLCSDRVTCDVLLLGGERDAFQPLKLLRAQEAALVNAKSVTSRVFTRAEDADQHCQMGNIRLLLQVMTDWLETVEP
jgi:pimeloyl-ACP methyl ester carboxylesterase